MKWLPMRDFIAHGEGILAPERCAELIERFQGDPGVAPGGVFNADDGATTNTDKISFDLPIPDAGDWAPLHGHLHERVSKAVESICAPYPSLQIYPLGSTGYKIQMYPKGRGRFAWHMDALGPMTQARLLAMILYLNDVEEGGETAFHYQQLEIAPRAGTALFFPTAWTHMHCGRVPISDDKYIVSSFFQYQM